MQPALPAQNRAEMRSVSVCLTNSARANRLTARALKEVDISVERIQFQRILVTGCCGFIGSNFVRHALESDAKVAITNLDALTYAGNPDNLADIATNPRYRFVLGDIADRPMVLELVAQGKFDAIINFAAESHVDRSINDATPFLRTNVIGTQCLLDAARAAGVRRFLQVSTDEVYGTLCTR